MIGIYKIASPSGKIYIGQTVNMDKRVERYRRLDCQGQRRLYNSLAKYGWNMHTFVTIEECFVENLNKRERYWQDYYVVLGPDGLNCKLTKTGDRSGKMSEDSIKKRYIEVNQYEKNGAFIKKWPSIKKAAETLDIRKDSISACLINRQLSAGGFIWKYAVVGVGNIPGIGTRAEGSRDRVAAGQKCRKPIIQLSKEGVNIAEWSAILEASKAIGVSAGGISSCLTGRIKSVGGFIWQYKN